MLTSNNLRNLVGLLLAALTIALIGVALSEAERLGEQRQQEAWTR
jgi:hypothetical protein